MSDDIKAPYFDGTQLCAQIGGDFFFSDENGSFSDFNFVRALCGSCHFKKPCLEYALTHSVEGVWAGTTAKQRSSMRTQLGIRPIEYEYSRIRD